MGYYIWCDESDKKGKFYSNFYGGILVRYADINFVQSRIKSILEENNLMQELKWQRVTDNYLTKYQNVMDVFFDLIANNKAKIRIMFTQNAKVPTGLSQQHKDDEYFILYYHFFKHAFGFQYSNPTQERVYLYPYFDNLPETYSKRKKFKEYIENLNSHDYLKSVNLFIRRDDIAEVDSKSHPILQCLDVVLGSMSFRLNDKHLEKPEGSRIRGKRTIAKEKLYKHILKHIRSIHPNFNIGISTGVKKAEDHWEHSYRHWVFTPTHHEINSEFYK